MHGCDEQWWAANDGLPQYAGLKLCTNPIVLQRPWDVEHLHIRTGPERDDLVIDRPGLVGWGGNGGFQALNLAVQLRPRRIALVGYDMHVRDGVHWHGKHRGQFLSNPTRDRCEGWRRRLDRIAPVIADLGIEVVNCSEMSALTAYRKAPLEEVLEC